MTISSDTLLYFSFSSKPGTFGATIYRELFLRYGLNATYIPRIAPPPDSLVKSLMQVGANGASISMPLKSVLISQLHTLSAEVQNSNSCNTILFENGGAHGHNTDVHGAKVALQEAKLNVQSALIYGAGSVCQSLYLALQEVYQCEIFFTARNTSLSPERKRFFPAKNFQPGQKFDLLINATPSEAEANPILAGLIEQSSAFFELSVNFEASSSIKQAEKKGIPAIPGIKMAAAQLAKQFQIYTGIKVSLDEINEIIQLKYFAGKK